MTYFELHSKLLMCENDLQSFSDILKMPTYQNLPEGEFKQKMRSFMQNLYHRRKQTEEMWMKGFPKDYDEFVMMTRLEADDLLHIVAVCPKRMNGFELNLFDIFQVAKEKGKNNFHLEGFARIFKGEAFVAALLKDDIVNFDRVVWLIEVLRHEAVNSSFYRELVGVLKVWKKAFDADLRENAKKLSEQIENLWP